MICSILFAATSDDLKLLMIDPKMLELSIYEGIPHLISPVVTQTKVSWAPAENSRRDAEGDISCLLKRVCAEYRRYNNMISSEVRIKDSAFKTKKVSHDESETEDIEDKGDEEPSRLPYIVVIIDELTDLMMASAYEVEERHCKARADGEGSRHTYYTCNVEAVC